MEFRVTIYADLYAPDGPNRASSSSSSLLSPRLVRSNPIPTFPFARLLLLAIRFRKFVGRSDTRWK